MKKLLGFILLMAVLVAAVTGCGGAYRYDGRLTAADSLMHDNPDSALAIIQAVCPDSLTTEGDRAYRDLLLTQARYKCYIVATSDSDINRALAYYRQHKGEREKLTRAYIYKGAVMDELGHPDSAMFYYKHAEATCDEKDCYNLGYVNMRIGALYRDHYSMDGKAIEKYESALEYLNRTENTYLQLACMINLGSLYRLKMPDKSVSTLLYAKDIANQIGDTISLVKSLQALVQTYYTQKKYKEAFHVIKEVLALQNRNYNFEFYANVADVYSRLGMPDSAEYWLNLGTNHHFSNEIEKIMYYESVGEIALARGDSISYSIMDMKCKRLEDSLMSLSTSVKLMQAETILERDKKQQSHERHRMTVNRLLFILVCFLIAILFLCYLYYHRKHRYDKLLADIKKEKDNQLNDLSTLRNTIDSLQIKDVQLKDFITLHITLLREVMDACYHEPRNRLAKEIRQIVKYQDKNKSQWNKLYDYLDVNYHDIMKKTRVQFPQLNDKDLLLLALSCMGYSCIEIAIVTGYSNATSISGNKQRLAHKMGLECSLNDYINRYKEYNN